MGSKARTITASHYAAALLGCTTLAGLPNVALAQDAAPPAEAVPVVQVQEDIIRAITVRGAQRLEPEKIVSYISLRPGDT